MSSNSVKKLTVKGLASGKSYTYFLNENDFKKTLLEFLTSQSLPIASSCSGEGICRKCVVNNDLLSCQVTIKELIKISEKGNMPITICVGYL